MLLVTFVLSVILLVAERVFLVIAFMVVRGSFESFTLLVMFDGIGLLRG
jgi:hypothetical protein